MGEFARSLAIVIGINKYKNGISQFKTAVADAVAIARILQDSYQYQLVYPDYETGQLSIALVRENVCKVYLPKYCRSISNQLKAIASSASNFHPLPLKVFCSNYCGRI